MNCQYCNAQIEEDSHRCGRCGRRLADSGPRMFPVQHSAAAPALDPAPTREPEAAVAPSARPQLVRDLPRTPAEPITASTAVQPSLFGPMEVARATTGKSRAPGTPSRRKGAADTTQQRFDFETTTANGAHAAAAGAAEVALPQLRVAAATLDMLVPVVGFALFLGTLHLLGYDVEYGAPTLPFYAASFALITMFYRLLCCLGNVDTLGLQWTGLRLLTSRGHRPGPRARVRRLFGGLVSTSAVGIGLVWALFDEQHLTWHDYMSDTFPTSTFRNR